MKACNPLTLKASSLNRRDMETSTLMGLPSILMGHPVGVHVSGSRSGGTTHPRLLRGYAFSVLWPSML